jgi:hypothetical protein
MLPLSSYPTGVSGWEFLFGLILCGRKTGLSTGQGSSPLPGWRGRRLAAGSFFKKGNLINTGVSDE